MTHYAKDSTIDINPDRWGNLIVDVNGENIVVVACQSICPNLVT